MQKDNSNKITIYIDPNVSNQETTIDNCYLKNFLKNDFRPHILKLEGIKKQGHLNSPCFLLN